MHNMHHQHMRTAPVVFISDKKYILSSTPCLWETIPTAIDIKEEISRMDIKNDTTKVSAAILTTEDGRILIARRKKGKHKGRWEFPGGKIEKAESPQDALVRELQEELKLNINKKHLVFFDINITDNIAIFSFFAKLCMDSPSSTDHDKIQLVSPEKLTDYPLLEADIKIAKHIEEIIKNGYIIKYKHAEDRT